MHAEHEDGGSNLDTRAIIVKAVFTAVFTKITIFELKRKDVDI